MAKFDIRLLLIAPTILLGGDVRLAADAFGPVWSSSQLEQLDHWAAAAPSDGLPKPDTRAFNAAKWRGQPAEINRTANELSANLARTQLHGAAAPEEKAEWFIADSDSVLDLAPRIAAALEADQLDAFITSLRPDHPAYAALRSALATETDPAKREVLTRNMERWRWLPRSLGDEYLLANAAGYEVSLWRGSKRVKSWPAISGKVTSQTPSIAAIVTAVNFNPWWEVPASIAEETKLTANGSFVWNGKRFRQKPGPGNSLGRMKLIMPNSYNIYLHDTPSRGLFGAQQRAFSHGCLRVSDALGFAAVLLEGSYGRQRIDRLFKTEEGEEMQSTVVALAKPLPVYVTYFTVDLQTDGSLAWHKDIYQRDARIVAVQTRDAVQLAAQ